MNADLVTQTSENETLARLTPYPTLLLFIDSPAAALYLFSEISGLTLMSISSVRTTPCQPPTTLSSVSHNPHEQPPTILPTNRNSRLPFWGILSTYICGIFLDHCLACQQRMLLVLLPVLFLQIQIKCKTCQIFLKSKPTNFPTYQIKFHLQAINIDLLFC